VPSSQEKRFSQGRAAGGSAAAYAEALVARSWNVAQFADWMRAQAAIASERPTSLQHIAALRAAATTFLTECTNLRAADRPALGLLIDKAGTTLDVRQLSDGERGILSMALDLARRISQANPGLDRPLEEGQATVLIDEIDLHLHPKWQRPIAKNLQSAFPRCQFIATTHSPQVIGEVEHDRIQIIADGQVYSPTHSHGVDSSRVLEEVMDADPRAKEVQNLLTELSQLIGKERFGSARIMLAQLVGRLGENDPEVTRIRTLLDFIEGKE
jgi:AAA domain, putative AbiEii toxin, Type IV TA system